MTKQTPAPWRVRRTNDMRFAILGAVPNTPTPAHYVAVAEVDADARLIAAAPALLDALRVIADSMSENVNPLTRALNQSRALRQARAAIADATGEEN